MLPGHELSFRLEEDTTAFIPKKLEFQPYMYDLNSSQFASSHQLDKLQCDELSTELPDYKKSALSTSTE